MSLITNTSLICIIMLSMMISTARPSASMHPINGRRTIYSNLWLFLFGLSITFMAAFRLEFQDTGVYKEIYSNMELDYSYAYEESLAIQDYGFNLFMIFLKRINPDPQFLVITTSTITFSCYFYTIGKYARNLPMSLFLMMALNMISSMNGIRQVLAGSITLLGLPLIRDKKAIPYILLVLLASTLHKSALVLIPLYFVFSGKRMNLGIWIFLIAVFGCFLFPSYATRVMGELLEDSVYKDYLSGESSMGYMRFLVALVPLILIILYCWVQQDNHAGENRHSPQYLNQRIIDVMINMEVVSFGFTALGMRMVYFARLSMYFHCILPMLLPVLLNNIFRKESARLMRVLSIVLYAFYYSYQIYVYYTFGGWNNFVLNL